MDEDKKREYAAAWWLMFAAWVITTIAYIVK